MSATKPKPFVPTNPVGADLLIETMRSRLAAELPWLEYALGRGVVDGDGQTRVQLERASNKQDNDYYIFTPNDFVKAQCCFVVEGNVSLNDYRAGVGVATYTIHLLITFNMAKMSTEYNYDYTETIAANVLAKLSKMPVLQGGTIRSYSFGKAALEGYVPREKMDKFVSYPYGAIRITLDAQARTCIDTDFIQYTC